ncbi:stalk domain-containing protein [Bacillus sp. Marseille-P3661]|uniref:stalk domain-containing protein n=1 Tax=Bacillus sp. Marseille-P3661 TaxID=1936234 RepID=UPI000C8680D7|nr:hypothetical protein [Bacillus sp. Marseille-P3661]
MIKRVAVLLLMLLVTITGLIGYQWILYKLNNSNLEIAQHTPLDTEIELFHNNEKILIEQKVSNLLQSNFIVKLPHNISDLRCKTANGDNCNLVNEGREHRIYLENKTTVSFTYAILTDSQETAWWFDDWFVQFSNLENEIIPMNFEVMLTEKNKTTSWVAGASEIAIVEKDHLDYYVWSKQDSSELVLYMTSDSLHDNNEYGPLISIYSSEQKQDIEGLHNLIDKLSSQFELTIVRSAHDDVYYSSQLIVVPLETESKKIEELILSVYIKRFKQPYNDDIAWIWDVLPAFILDRPVGTSKVYEMSVELLEHVPSETKESFRKWLLEENVPAIKVNSLDLDHHLKLGTHLSTTFFSKNINQTAPLVPFYYTESRSVFFQNRKLNNDWAPVVRNEEVYFPFEVTLKGLGFNLTVFSKEKLYLLSKSGNSWRFYLDKTYFIYNQEDYGLLKKPLEQFDGEVFISEKWLEQLLKVDVIKRENGIYLM